MTVAAIFGVLRIHDIVEVREYTIIGINRIYHLPPMQTGKSHPKGKRIMSKTRFAEYPALSADPITFIT